MSSNPPRPRNASQTISGTVARPCNEEPCGITPNSTAIPEAASRGPPMTPKHERVFPILIGVPLRSR